MAPLGLPRAAASLGPRIAPRCSAPRRRRGAVSSCPSAPPGAGPRSLPPPSPTSALPGRGVARSPPPMEEVRAERAEEWMCHRRWRQLRDQIRGSRCCWRRSARGFLSHRPNRSCTSTCWGHWGNSPSPPTVKTARAKFTLARPSAIPSAMSPHALNYISFPWSGGKGTMLVRGTETLESGEKAGRWAPERGLQAWTTLLIFYPCTVLSWWGSVATKVAEQRQSAEQTQLHLLAVRAWVSDSTSLGLSFDICTRGGYEFFPDAIVGRIKGYCEVSNSRARNTCVLLWLWFSCVSWRIWLFHTALRSYYAIDRKSENILSEASL